MLWPDENQMKTYSQPERPPFTEQTHNLPTCITSKLCIHMLDRNGKVLPYLFEARKRGGICDVGHGGGSFDFRQAIPAVRQGFLPDSISTDLHIGSMNAEMKDMTNVMSKFLNLGMSAEKIILRSTWNPAHEMQHEELGQLPIGAPADVSVLRMGKGNSVS